MEPLGVAVNVINVVNLSAKIASLCIQYSRDVKNAKSDIESLQREVVSLSHTFQEVERLLHGPDSVRLSASQELRDAVENCLSQLTAIKTRLEPNKTSKAMSLVGVRALKWPFQSKEVEKVLKNLERCTQTVSLALGVDQLW